MGGLNVYVTLNININQESVRYKYKSINLPIEEKASMCLVIHISQTVV